MLCSQHAKVGPDEDSPGFTPHAMLLASCRRCLTCVFQSFASNSATVLVYSQLSVQLDRLMLTLQRRCCNQQLAPNESAASVCGLLCDGGH